MYLYISILSRTGTKKHKARATGGIFPWPPSHVHWHDNRAVRACVMKSIRSLYVSITNVADQRFIFCLKLIFLAVKAVFCQTCGVWWTNASFQKTDSPKLLR